MMTRKARRESERGAWSDAELLVALSEEDRTALEELHGRWRRRLVAFFVARGVSLSDVDDLVADCWLTVWLRRSRYTGTDGSAWLFGIARWELGKYRRRHTARMMQLERLASINDLVDISDIERVINRVDAESMRLELREALLDLPEIELRAVALRVVEGRTYREISEICLCSEGAARMRVHRGIQRLRSRLQIG